MNKSLIEILKEKDKFRNRILESGKVRSNISEVALREFCFLHIVVLMEI